MKPGANIKHRSRHDMFARFVLGVIITVPSLGLAQDEESESDRNRHERLLERFDAGGDGTLGPGERGLAREEFTSARLDRILKRVDRDGDGTLSDEVRRHAQSARDRLDRNDDGRIRPRERDRIRQFRQRADRNDDGRIGPREKKAVRRARSNRN